jgi:3-(3-hydroxy-phenyl)propionate hydroxylase
LFDLVIIGCGPVGAVAANLAGAAGMSTAVVERDQDVFALPRAVHVDAHIMRILQEPGLADALATDMLIQRQSTFYGADGKPIRIHAWSNDKPLGWNAHYLFYQPQLEAGLRAHLHGWPAVQMRLGTEAVDIRQSDDHVAIELDDGAELRSRFLLAADGATSFVRRMLGIPLLDSGFDEPWMVIDLLTDKELGRPGESEMFCDPRRPATRVPGPGLHHRFEFMLLPGESPEAIQRPESIARLLAPWVEVGEVEILRASVYRFHALVAERWRQGRTFLAGDAAHQTPVFLGQGLCHGIRDVHNLIWKLGAALDGGDGQALLDSYEAERRPHVEAIIAMSVASGRDICLLDPALAAKRDARMRREWELGILPSTTFQGLPPLHGGLFTGPGAGELTPQPQVRSADGRLRRMDDAIGRRPAVVALPDAAAGLAPALSAADAALIVAGDSSETPMEAATMPPIDLGVPVLLESGQLRAWLAERQAEAAIVRPDRYVHAFVGGAAEAAMALTDLGRLLRGGEAIAGLVD